MTSQDEIANKRNQSASLSVLPILLLAIAVIAAISTLSRNAYVTNAHNEHLLELRRIELALDNEGRDFAETVQREVNLMVVNAPERQIDMEKMSRYLASEHNADFIAVYAREGKLLSVSSSRSEIMDRRLRASDELIAHRRELKTPFAMRRLGMSATFLEPRALIAMSAIDVNHKFEVVISRRIQDLTLTRIGRSLLLENLRFTEDASPRSPADDEIPVGLVWNDTKSGAFTLETVAFIGYLGVILVGIYGLLVFIHVRRVTQELVSSEAEAKHLAAHDTLSGLPNRTAFSRALNQKLDMVTPTRGLAVMYLDLDRFKEVNDEYGHACGDQLIVEVAQRLSQLVRGSYIVARFGGDEFAIIQTAVKSPGDCASMASRILEVLHHPFDLDGATVSIGASIGISLSPANAIDAATLMRYADVALYRAKRDGRNRYSFFEEQMNEFLQLSHMIENDLRSAIENEQLILHYQPLVTADGEKVVGVEALVRWNHPTRGIIPPDQFISIAEERGLINALGEWVLRRACIDSRNWPGLITAVNVSRVQFKHRGFVAGVARILEETGMNPAFLELEVTEGVVIEDADKAEAAMLELRALGVRMALDDFGVGYSSLIYLRRFAFDKIKIDRSFLESMESVGESAILVHSIVHLGRALGLDVIAEGVETESQRRFLQAVGCHQLQGYYFSRPCPADQLVEYVSNLANKDMPASVAA